MNSERVAERGRGSSVESPHVDARPFDRIEIKEGASWLSIPLERWLKGDANRRVDQIMAGQVKFSLHGAPVRTSDALKYINSLK